VFTLSTVVPWGRSFDEYRRMFLLTEGDLRQTILGCADGPASFNVEASALGVRVVSADPLYKWTCAEIRGRIAATSASILEQTRENFDEFVWTDFASVDALGAARMRAMNRFLADYEEKPGASRYVAAALPALPFVDRAFDIVVCSHFLFLYTAQTTERFHLDAVDELCRVGTEVRIFPLLALGARPSPYVPVVVDHLRASGRQVTIEEVPYEFQRGGNQMLRCFRGG
jgi:hypothetical protein